MLTMYRRHREDCPHREEGRTYRRCRCPIHIQGRVRGQEVRQSLKETNWEEGEKAVEKLKSGTSEEQEPMAIDVACDKFIADAEVRGLRGPVVDRYRLLLRRLKDFARDKGFRFLQELTVDALRDFRVTWPLGPSSAGKALDSLRAFFRFCFESGWVADNPARRLRPPKVTMQPTMPFTPEEFMKILGACDFYPDEYGRTGQENARRLRALVLLLRYGGLRIRDAVTLRRDCLVGDKLFLYTAKTGTPVWCPLPPFLVMALEAVTNPSRDYFFWTGRSKPETVVGDWERAFRKLFRIAGIPGGRPHRFRDTFAVELLLAGVPLERVSVLLGHQSVKVTEKHYAPWVRARQEQLESDVRRTWGESVPAAKGTREVHGTGEDLIN